MGESAHGKCQISRIPAAIWVWWTTSPDFPVPGGMSMRKSSVRFGTVIMIAWFTQTNTASGQASFPPPPDPKVDERYFPAPALVDMALKVEILPGLPRSKMVIHQEVAAYLTKSRIGIPDDRARFYDKMIQPESPLVKGWHGFIEQITPTDSGVIVTLRVQAVQERTMDNLSLLERYSIVNGRVTYLDCFAPPLKHRIILMP